jgi:hypothetical protein
MDNDGRNICQKTIHHCQVAIKKTKKKLNNTEVNFPSTPLPYTPKGMTTIDIVRIVVAVIFTIVGVVAFVKCVTTVPTPPYCFGW